MKLTRLFLFVALLAGCVQKSTDEFVQESIRIVPPVEKVPDHVAVVLEDGGTTIHPIRDARGKVFEVYIDHRLGTKSPGAIYLNAYPSERDSVRVTNQAEFRQKVKFE